MREVGAPEHAVGRSRDQRRDERNRVLKRLPPCGDPLAAGNLYPRELVSHELEQQLKRLLVEPLLRLHTAHVIDDKRHAQTGKEIAVSEEVLGIEMQHHVSA